MEALQYPTKTKSRKERMCDFCYGKISKEEYYMKSVFKDGGRLIPFNTHEHCEWLTHELNMYEGGEGLSPDDFQEFIHNRFIEISMQSECLINAPTFKDKLALVYNYHINNQPAPTDSGNEK